MRRALLVLAAVAAVAAAVLVLRAVGTGSRGTQTDAGATRYPGEPGGPGVREPMGAPLDLRAEVRSRGPEGIRLAIEARALENFTRVQIVAARYDAAPTVAWAETLWVGPLDAGRTQRLETVVPVADPPPQRIVVTAGGASAGGARHSTSDVVHLDEAGAGASGTAMPAPPAAFDSLRPVEDR